MCSYKNERFLVYLVLVSFLFLSSCAFGTRRATLDYPPPPSGQSVALAAEVQTTDKGISVLVEDLKDVRDEVVIGHVRNGLGMKTATVVALNSVKDWVNDAIKYELKENGYTVVTEDKRDDADLVISGEIDGVYCDAYLTYKARVELLLIPKKEGKTLLNKYYRGQGSAGANIAMTAKSYGDSLTLALKDALDKFIEELNMKVAAFKDD